MIQDYRRALIRILIRSYQRARAVVVTYPEGKRVLDAVLAPKGKPKKKKGPTK